MLAEVRKQTGQEVVYIADRSKMAAYLQQTAREGDLIMTMGAGDIYKTGEELAAMLKK